MNTRSFLSRSAYAICFAFVMSFTSCGLFDKSDDKTFDVVLEHTFKINVNYEETDFTYLSQEILDAAAASSDFNNYKNKIKIVVVNRVSYVIQNCTTPDVVFENAALAYSSLEATTFDATKGQSADLGIQNVKAAEGRETTLQFADVAKIEMSTYLKSSKMFNVYLNGVIAKTPAQFDVVMRVYATVTADQL